MAAVRFDRGVLANAAAGPFRPDGRVEIHLAAGWFDSGSVGEVKPAKLVWHDRR